MEIIYGTHNMYKVEAACKSIKKHKLDVKILTTKDIGFDKDIVEDGNTFEENSEIKAKAIKEYCDAKRIKGIILADDAGLCVDVLNGEPGIYTSRYAGENPTQEENINKLLNNLKPYKEMKDRTCKLVCVLTTILPNGEKIVTKGECKGSIALKPGKFGGLTYGPVFIPYGFDKPMGDMEEKEYEKVCNHREVAINKLISILKEKGY